MEYRDKTIRCAECGREFVWSAPEQFAYVERGLRHEPRRCRECRLRAAARRSGGREAAECHARGKGARRSESE